MFLTIVSDNSEEVLVKRELGENESLAPDDYVKEFEAAFELELSKGDGIVPLGCGDITIEIAEVPRSAVCWAAKSYMIA